MYMLSLTHMHAHTHTHTHTYTHTHTHTHTFNTYPLLVWQKAPKVTSRVFGTISKDYSQHDNRYLMLQWLEQTSDGATAQRDTAEQWILQHFQKYYNLLKNLEKSMGN